MSDFSRRDPTGPEFWDERFSRDFTPWDAGGAPADLRRFVAGAHAAGSVLIPGCGAGHEVALFAQAGWDVTAIDFSPVAVARARALLGDLGRHVLEADFFAYTPPRPPDLVYERAFLCALPPAMWPRVAERWAALLPPGALLAGTFFFDDAPKGPPFGAQPDRLRVLLAPFFEQTEDAAATDSVPVFAGKERWQVWRRLP